jgi:chromosome partitioning protein
MHIITVINAKGGCGKSTIAMGLASGLARLGYPTLLIDMDQQAQVTQWLGLGDGLLPEGTLVAAMEGRQSLEEIIQQTAFENLSFIASSQQLEDLGRQITDMENYATVFTGLLASLTRPIEFVVIDSPNQISPVMENAIFPSDAFVVPFESTKAVRSYANFFQLLLRLRPEEEHRVLHVLSNLSRQRGLRQRVIEATQMHGIALARTEIHTCGWLAQVDENGGNIFEYRPYSRGAEDMALLVQEVLEFLRRAQPLPPQEIGAESPQPVSATATVSGDEHHDATVAAAPQPQPEGRGLPINESQQQYDQAA